MSYYECKRCGHKTKQRIEMNRHLKRKKKCLRNIDSYNYLDSELEKMSLIKHNLNDDKNKINNSIIDDNTQKEHKQNVNNIKYENNKFEIKNENDEQIKNENNEFELENIYDLKKKLNLNIDNINDLNKLNELNHNNNFKCLNCNKIFTRKFNLNRHLLNCNMNYSNKNLNKIHSNNLNENKDLNNELNNVNHYNQTNNTTNNYNTINNNYNKNLYLNFNVEPFDNDWDVSRISKFTRHSILLSKIMYSNLLDNILQNEKNLNVVIEKETNTGLVYKNNVEKFITMNMQDIIDKSMDKLNKHLKDFYKESLKDDEFVIMDKIFHEQLKNVENKYDDFKNNDEIKKKVEEFITQIYDKKKENAIKLYNNTLLKNDNDITGY